MWNYNKRLIFEVKLIADAQCADSFNEDIHNMNAKENFMHQ